jgi:hypothetical protein
VVDKIDSAGMRLCSHPRPTDTRLPPT